MATESDIKRFMDKVHILKGEDNCWVWLGARSRGKGNKKWYGSFHYKGKTIRAHVFSYMFLSDKSKCEKTGHIDHVCGFSLCVNPNHLQRVSCEENERRKRSRHIDT